MGQPDILNRMPPDGEHMAGGSYTRGSETSQYPQEEKTNEIA